MMASINIDYARTGFYVRLEFAGWGPVGSLSPRQLLAPEGKTVYKGAVKWRLDSGALKVMRASGPVTCEDGSGVFTSRTVP